MKVQIVPEYVSLRTYKTYSRPYPARLVYQDMRAAKTFAVAKVPCHEHWKWSIPGSRQTRVYIQTKAIIHGKRVGGADLFDRGSLPLREHPIVGPKDTLELDIEYEDNGWWKEAR